MLYEVVIDVKIVDLGVIGSPEPVRIVTVNRMDIIREAIQASFLHGTQEPLIHIVLLQAPKLRTLDSGGVSSTNR